MIKIVGYQHVNGVSFGSEESAITSVFGEPNARHVNDGDIELHYPLCIARLQVDSKIFREFTLLPECEASVNDIRVQWSRAFLSEIQKADSSLFEVVGFVLSLKLGLAFSGFHDDDYSQMAIHAFCVGDWDMFQTRMKPFHFE
jgi:hypothetical protein